MRIIKAKIQSVTDGEYQKILNAIGLPSEEINSRSYFQHCGFSSIPKQNTVGIAIIYGNQVTFFASADPASSRPTLSSEGDVCIYSDADKYVKILSTGEIKAGNNNNSITLKADGDIEIGSSSLKKLLTEDAASLYNTHTHNDPASGTTGVPNQLMNSTHQTTKTEAE